jgi:hypothetical protein
MTVAPFTPKPLTEEERDVRFVALQLACGFDREATESPFDVVAVAEVYRRFLMGLPIVLEG